MHFPDVNVVLDALIALAHVHPDQILKSRTFHVRSSLGQKPDVQVDQLPGTTPHFPAFPAYPN